MGVRRFRDSSIQEVLLSGCQCGCREAEWAAMVERKRNSEPEKPRNSLADWGL